ncbi:hypothetical protein BCR44DRAFT_1441696 [Catenaria anguillulae PL171]|uniref:Translation initiation factor eIF2B subunit gamma n=1 Tax=Catenaria anguillulae PL171 TaxID=765915 RepID=A0A1Y2HAN8_9FUNG|nr:hypothetical protein BCR44DRAFT_1441696 [Catenaria anguillulae PL171]
MYPISTSRIAAAQDPLAAALQEVQAVLLCGPGTDLAPLTSNSLPKALLPIAGKPLLHYALQWIDAASPAIAPKDVLVVSSQSGLDHIQTFVRSLDSARRPEVVAVDDKLGSAEALFKIRDKLKPKKHTLVMAVDSIPTESPAAMMDQLRIHDAAAVALLFDSGAPTSADSLVALPVTTGSRNASPANAANASLLSSTATAQRLISSTSLARLDAKHASSGMPLRMDMMRSFPNLRLQKLTDAHVYLVRNWVLAAMLAQMDPEINGDGAGIGGSKKQIASVQHDLIPLLLKAQYMPAARAIFTDTDSDASSKGADADDLPTSESSHDDSEYALVGLPTPSHRRDPVVLALVSKSSALSSSSDDHGSTTDLTATAGGASGPSYLTLAHLGLAGLRTATVAAYLDANRLMARLVADRIAPSVKIAPRSQVGPESMMGDNTALGERSSVKKSVVGANCVLGRNVKLVNCVVHDGVVIEDDVKLEGCVVCAGARVGEKCTLKEAVVGGKAVVARETVARGERYV